MSRPANGPLLLVLSCLAVPCHAKPRLAQPRRNNRGVNCQAPSIRPILRPLATIHAAADKALKSPCSAAQIRRKQGYQSSRRNVGLEFVRQFLGHDPGQAARPC